MLTLSTYAYKQIEEYQKRMLEDSEVNVIDTLTTIIETEIRVTLLVE